MNTLMSRIGSIPRRLLAVVALSAIALVAPAVRAQAPAAAKAAAAPVDLNSADEAALQTLPGVGPVLAKQIVAARPFNSVEDLSKVKGIGPAKMAALRDRVTVGGHAVPSAMPTMPAAPPRPSMPAMPKPSAPAAPMPATAPAMPMAKPMPMPNMPAMPMGKPAGMGKPGMKMPSGPVNINTASESDLESLPGIGPVKAKAIVAGRPYAKVEDVMKVPGIKAGIFGKIKDLITVQ